jgi:hypothetical protein
MVQDAPDGLAPALHVATVATPAALPPAALALSDAAGDVFSTLPWYANLAATVYDKPGQLRFDVVAEAAATPDGAGPGRVRLVMPLLAGAEGTPFRGRVLRAGANFYASLFTPLHAADAAPALLAWARSLAAQRPRWDVVDLSPMDVDAPLFAQCEQALRAANFRTQRYFCFGNWYLRVGGRSYEEYFHGLPSKLRHTVLRKSRQLAANADFRIAVLSTPHQVQQAVRAFDRVYARSWKHPEPYPAFIPGLIRMLAAQGWLRMGVAYLGNNAVAFQLWIVRGRTAAIYKLAYDEAYAKLSVGSVLTSALMRQAIDEDAVEEIDYLTGDEDYKRDWMSDRRERWGLVGFNRATWRGLAGSVRHGLGAKLRSIVKRQPAA